MKDQKDCNCDDCLLAEGGPLALAAKWLCDNWMLFPPALLLASDFFHGNLAKCILDMTLMGIIVLLLKIAKKVENCGPWY